MISILITGKNSFIGKYFENYLRKWPNKYKVDSVNMVSEEWRDRSFNGYDVVFHVAGIAHSDNGREDDKKRENYYKVNTKLAIDTANKAKYDGVKQFIFMSSAIVYGSSAPIGKNKIIKRDTPVSPTNYYGESKVQAEKGLIFLNESSFKVVILRVPMVYGKGSKGNYSILSNIALKFPVFPKVMNKRSIIYIENLVEFVRLMVENEENGIFWPQNNELGNTSEIVKMIAATHGRKVYLIKGFTTILKIISLFTKQVNKAFGNLEYDKEISRYKQNYVIKSLEQSINETETKDYS